MFRVIWSHQAESDYINTLQYWIEHNKSNRYSSKLIAEVEKTEKLISKNPYIGTLSEIEGIRYVLIDKIFLSTTESLKILLRFLLFGTTEETRIHWKYK